MKQLLTKDYGTISYEDADLFEFPDGLFGFPEIHHYLPLCLNDQEDTTMLLLQGVENVNVAFVVFNPFVLDPDYHPVLTPEELSYLGVRKEDELSYYVTCVLKDNYLENTVNMKCPLVLNPALHKGMQVILEGSKYEYRHRLDSFPSVLSGKKNDPSGRNPD